MKILSTKEEVYQYKLSKWKLSEEARTAIFSIMMMAKMLDIKTTIKITDSQIRRINNEFDIDGACRHRFTFTFECDNEVNYRLNLLSSLDFEVECAQVLKNDKLVIESWYDYVDKTIHTMHEILTK